MKVTRRMIGTRSIGTGWMIVTKWMIVTRRMIVTRMVLTRKE